MSDKKITPVTNNESVLEFDPNAGLHRVYDWKPYTIHGKVIHPCINLYSLQKFFAGLDFPLEDEYTIHSTPCPRNQGAVDFLKAVQALPDHCKTGR